MKWVETYIAHKAIEGTLEDFFNGHIVEVRRHWTSMDSKNVIYDLYSDCVTGSRLARVTSILVPTALIDSSVNGDKEELNMFRQLAKDGKITEDMLDSTL